MATKQDLATKALRDIGLSLPISASSITDAVDELRDMCLSFENEGIYVGFNNTPANSPQDQSGISDIHRDAVIKNLAVRMSDILDVVISPGYAGRAKNLLNGITDFVIPEYEANPFLPEGAGDRLYDQQYFFNSYQYPDEIFYVSVGEKVQAEKQLHDDNVDGNIVSTSWTVQTSTITITDTTLEGTIARGMVSFSAEGDYIVKILVTYDNGQIDAKCLSYQVSECRESPNLYRYPNGNRI
jgi:hypothetical protein